MKTQDPKNKMKHNGPTYEMKPNFQDDDPAGEIYQTKWICILLPCAFLKCFISQPVSTGLVGAPCYQVLINSTAIVI